MQVLMVLNGSEPTVTVTLGVNAAQAATFEEAFVEAYQRNLDRKPSNLEIQTAQAQLLAKFGVTDVSSGTASLQDP